MLRTNNTVVICAPPPAAGARCHNEGMVEPDALFDVDPPAGQQGGFAALAELPLSDLVSPGWAQALADVEPQLRDVLTFLGTDADAGHHILPSPSNVLRAFAQPFDQVRVLIVGQDPYPTPGHAVGLSFAVAGSTRPIPRSLANIYRELAEDLGIPPRVHGDLSAWADQGVLLLNRVLSVRAGAAGSHRRKGWEAITTAAITALAQRTTADGSPAPLVAVLWGKDAESVRPLLGGTPIVSSAHPSPLSASRGFFGSKPFSAVNRLLLEQGAAEVTWELPALP